VLILLGRGCTRSWRFCAAGYVYRPKVLHENLPWDFINHGMNKEPLLKEYKVSFKEEESE
jgi:hypothetical protein